jgi:hypothetical protein
LKQPGKGKLMFKTYFFVAVFGATVLFSCSKKTHPAQTTTTENSNSSIIKEKKDSVIAKRAIIKRKSKVVIPKVITVNDSAAHKSVDGRLYYDVMGHRYWRNYKDGKYYLFNKSMYNDDAFKKPD